MRSRRISPPSAAPARRAHPRRLRVRTEPAAAEPASPSNAAAAAGLVTDPRNKKINLKGPATKVVALEWGAAENLVTLGVMPVGVADIKGYAALGQGRAARRVGEGRRHPG